MKRIFRATIFFLFLFVWSITAIAQQGGSDPYKFLEVADQQALEQRISSLEVDNNLWEKAYKGTLLMKKAEVAKTAAEKLSTFKEGNALLEEAISKDSDNVEFRFFRLIIQENAPKILGYHKNIAEDSLHITNGFSKLHPQLKSAILAYSKNSRALEPEELR